MLYLSVESNDPVSDLEDLSEWLGREPELRGLIKDGDRQPGPGELGAMADVLVAAVGSGGALTVLVTSLLSYLSNNKGTDLMIKVKGPRGSVTVDAKRVKDPEALLRAIREDAGLE